MSPPRRSAGEAAGTVARDLPELITTMAHATMSYPFKIWGFGESIAMEALICAGGESGRLAVNLVTEWARHHDPLVGNPLAHVAPGVPLLLLVERGVTDHEPLFRSAHELATVLSSNVVGQHGAQIHRPDLEGWEHEVWVDCMHLDGPFLSLLARMSGDDTHAHLAADVLLSHARVLQDERSGLFSHGFDDAAGKPNHVHWGRGQGWALLGLLDTAANLPDAHSTQEEIRQRLIALVQGLAATEAAPGAWHTVVDAPETYLESSVSAFVALGVRRGIASSILPPMWFELAKRAWDSTLSSLSDDGFLLDVSDATPVGPNAAHYGSRDRGSYPWGQGPALLAAVERLRIPDSSLEPHHDPC
jgi:rhamnogalacturonyl hydrolase YesR